MSTQTMKAVMQTAYGESSKVLQVTSVPLPTMNENSDDLLVRVKAVSINPLDSVILKGELRVAWTDTMPFAVGSDVSGVVVKAGKAAAFKEGDEVYGFLQMRHRGSLAEYCVIPASTCAHKPKNLTHEEAACLPMVGCTAMQVFECHSGPKDTAFIPGGLGGVGSMALQLAKPWAGFKKTITTVSTSKVAALKEHIKDVDEVMDYKTVDPETVIPAHSCDFALDQFGKPCSYIRYLKKGTGNDKPSVVSIMTPPNAEKAQKGWETRLGLGMTAVLTVMDWRTRFTIPGWVHYDSISAVPSGKDMEVLRKLAEEGKVRPIVDKVFELDQTIEAFALAESKPAGKVVIRVLQ
ncbi:GroES-like protein [Dacryopinax primogenitus]|uniref:GroES-like protein n=1 Tax=Dacryopinax primogenitus (strain DJM 731) TaxID=1858805 RepID=M5GAD0_DACPD|nr:GroES-like protein [Dacryopinax primogenitus]EJU05295.1 GroES-like protein [Dacryopinax primogenitus]